MLVSQKRNELLNNHRKYLSFNLWVSGQISLISLERSLGESGESNALGKIKIEIKDLWH